MRGQIDCQQEHAGIWIRGFTDGIRVQSVVQNTVKTNTWGNAWVQARRVWFAMLMLCPHLSIFQQLAVFVTVTGAAGA